MNLFALLILVLMTSKNAASAGEATSWAVKTITSEDGEIIDCVGLYDQPAFKHPLLGRHKIVVNPLKHVNTTGLSRLHQNWHKSGTCPHRTIPVARVAYENSAVGFMQHLGKKRPTKFVKEVAVAYTTAIVGEAYKGTVGKIDVWKPYVEPNDMSINYILMGGKGYHQDGGGNDMEFSVLAGWRVAPFDYNGDLRPRAFVAFSNDSGASGCYNLGCGFIQTSNRIAIDAPISNTSTYGGRTLALRFAIAMCPTISCWKVYVGDEELGYYPEEVIQGFVEGGIAQWGGIVYIGGQGRGHTTSQMGSGHFPMEGETRSGKISSINNLYFHGDPLDPPRIGEITRPDCYGLQLLGKQGPDGGYAMYYGGPGGRCVGSGADPRRSLGAAGLPPFAMIFVFIYMAAWVM